jgi:hypothetical protein
LCAPEAEGVVLDVFVDGFERQGFDRVQTEPERPGWSDLGSFDDVVFCQIEVDVEDSLRVVGLVVDLLFRHDRKSGGIARRLRS